MGISLVQLESGGGPFIGKEAFPILGPDACDVRGGGEDGGREVNVGLVAGLNHQAPLVQDRVLVRLSNEHLESFEKIRNRT